MQVAAERPRACLNGMTWNPAAIHQSVPTGSQHLIIGDSLVRDLIQVLVGGQTTVISFGGASVAQVIKMAGSQCRADRTGDGRAKSGTIEPSEHQQKTGSVQNDLQNFEVTERNRKNLGKTKIDAFVPCGDDGMGV